MSEAMSTLRPAPVTTATLIESPRLGLEETSSFDVSTVKIPP